MLDEVEYESVIQLRRGAFDAAKENRIKNGLPIEGIKIEEIFRPLLEKYKEITGYEETNYNAIAHHRISYYGEPCKNCGKPLRTPQASFCAACGKIKE